MCLLVSWFMVNENVYYLHSSSSPLPPRCCGAASRGEKASLCVCQANGMERARGWSTWCMCECTTRFQFYTAKRAVSALRCVQVEKDRRRPRREKDERTYGVLGVDSTAAILSLTSGWHGAQSLPAFAHTHTQCIAHPWPQPQPTRSTLHCARPDTTGETDERQSGRREKMHACTQCNDSAHPCTNYPCA